jgi:hypothetical protein
VDGIAKFALVMFIVTGIPGMFMLLQPVFKALGKRLEGTRAADVEELETLRSEVAELRALPERVQELEERLDFAERMLAQQREHDRLPGGS